MFTLTKNSTAQFVAILLAATIAFTYATSAHAAWGNWGMHKTDKTNVLVSVQNYADVTNTVTASTHTGNNVADAGSGMRAGMGGNASGHGDVVAGDGGNGGHGGEGGVVITGNASAYASALNQINSNETRVSLPMMTENETDTDYPFGRSNKSHKVEVDATNKAALMNTVSADARTAHNEANGGDGSVGGNGGNAHAQRSYFNFWHADCDCDTASLSMSGNGGNGGHGGMGGQIMTGEALSGSEVVNVMNQNITRVIR